MNRQQRTRISAYAIILRDERMLLVRCSADTDAPGKWTLPGGGIDFGEDPAAAAVREVREETGFDVRLTRLATIDSRVIHAADTDHHAIRILYHAKIVGGILTTEVDGSTDLCEWIPINTAAEFPLVELVKVALLHVRDSGD